MKFKSGKLAALVLCIAVFLGGCKQISDTIDNVGSAVGNAVGQMLSGNVTGEVGKIYSTQWFTFTVKSIEKVSEYAGYTPQAGFVLYDVVIEETCTFEAAIPMGTVDFYMDDPNYADYVYPLVALDDTMMPEEFDLQPQETAEYHMVYELPEAFTDLMLIYTEIDEEDNVGATFTIHIK